MPRLFDTTSRICETQGCCHVRRRSLSMYTVPKWRNWQTRVVQVHVLARVWGFESLLRHQKSINSFKMNDLERTLYVRFAVFYYFLLFVGCCWHPLAEASDESRSPFFLRCPCRT